MARGCTRTDLQAHFVDGLRSRRVPEDPARAFADGAASCGLLDTLADEPDALDLADWIGAAMATQLARFGGNRDAGVLRAFDLICSGRTPDGWRPPDEVLDAFLRTVSAALDIDDYGSAAAQLRETDPNGCPSQPTVRRLLAHDLMRPDSVIDAELVRSRAPGRLSFEPDSLHTAVRTPEFWLHEDRRRAVEALAKLLRSEPDDSLATFAAGLENSLRAWFHCEEALERLAGADHDPAFRRWEFYSGSEWYAFAPLLEPIIRHLADRSLARPADAGLRATWLRFTHRAFGHDPDSAPADLVASALRVADKSWGMARAIFSKNDVQALERNRGALREASTVLMLFASMEKCIEPMVLALRAARTPCVSSSLEYREGTEDDCLPEPWTWLPDLIALRLHYGLRAEQRTDPDLASARGRLCGFLLSRLKTRKGEGRPTHGELASPESMMERGPAWRIGYIRAASSLFSNPKGKGHALLNWSRRHDPDRQVRDEARTAYVKMRHAEAPPGDTSVRRCFFEAFRWLRWAHMVSLGREVSEEGVQRTLRREIRATERPRSDG